MALGNKTPQEYALRIGSSPLAKGSASRRKLTLSLDHQTQALQSRRKLTLSLDHQTQALHPLETHQVPWST